MNKVMNCSKCGSELNTKEEYCIKCGAKVSVKNYNILPIISIILFVTGTIIYWIFHHIYLNSGFSVIKTYYIVQTILGYIPFAGSLIGVIALILKRNIMAIISVIIPFIYSFVMMIYNLIIWIR